MVTKFLIQHNPPRYPVYHQSYIRKITASLQKQFPFAIRWRTIVGIDVITKDGNMKQWKGEANAGVLAGSVTLEGPVKKDKSAIIVSFRHSWINPMLRAMNAGISVNFYDLHAKFTQWIGKKDKLMVDVYAGQDELTLHRDYTNNLQSWGNRTASLAWNRLLGPKAFLSSSINYSRYQNIAGFRYNLYDQYRGIYAESGIQYLFFHSTGQWPDQT